MERGEAVAKLRAGIKLEGRNIHERYNIVEAIRLLMVKLLEELEGEREEVLNGFVEDERVKELDEVAKLLIERGMELIRDSEYNDGKVRIAGYIKEAYQVLGRRDFEKFLIAIEWNYPKDMKFYDIRENVLREWVKDLEDLEYGRLKILSISAPPRTGKALSMDSKILTPTGWKEMREIKEGDYVISADGKKAEVLGVFPQGKKEMYRVTFDDKTEVKCSGDHLWEVQSRYDRQKHKNGRIIKTEEMVDNLFTKRGEKQYSINLVKPIEFENHLKEDDLDAYLLGALIGNGTLNRPDIGFTTADVETLEKVKETLPEGDKISDCYRKYNYYITKKIKETRNKTKTCTKLIEYKLYGHKATTKFIPKKYLYSCIEDRIKLVRGLMDTDGCCNRNNIFYKTVSKQLAEDFAELIRGLGGKAFIRKYKQKELRYNDYYTISIEQLDFNPFNIKRKMQRYEELQNKKNRKLDKKYIKSIEQIEDEECQCIYVNHPSHLFVTDGYNLTHNTTVRGEIFFMVYAKACGEELFFCKSYTERWR